MNIDVFSPEQIINFCFMESEEINKLILNETDEMISYQRSVANGESFSEHKNKGYIRRIDVLTKCKQDQKKFINDFWDKLDTPPQ